MCGLCPYSLGLLKLKKPNQISFEVQKRNNKTRQSKTLTSQTRRKKNKDRGKAWTVISSLHTEFIKESISNRVLKNLHVK